MTEKGTPSETPRIEHLPSGLAMLCRPNGGCRPATKEELFFDSENSRLRDELEKKTAALEDKDHALVTERAEVERWHTRSKTLTDRINAILNGWDGNNPAQFMMDIEAARSALQPEDKHES